MSCKNCGRETLEGQEYCGECLFAALPVKKKSKRKKALLIVGAAVLGVVIAFAAYVLVSYVSALRYGTPKFSAEFSAQIQDNKSNPEPLVTSISEVITAYSQNQLKADLIYKGRWLQITGHTGEAELLGVSEEFEGIMSVPSRLYELGHEASWSNKDSMYAELSWGNPSDEHGWSEFRSRPGGEVMTIKGRFEGRVYVSLGGAYFAPHLTLYNCVIVPDPAES